jgi:hypothetical protein
MKIITTTTPTVVEKHEDNEASKAQKVLAQVKRVHPGLAARDCAFFSTQTSLVCCLHCTATSTTPTPTQTCPNANPDATGDFFWYFPPPKKGGGAGWGRAQQQQQESAAAAAATAAHQGQNERNTAMTRNRLRACEVVVF